MSILVEFIASIVETGKKALENAKDIFAGGDVEGPNPLDAKEAANYELAYGEQTLEQPGYLESDLPEIKEAADYMSDNMGLSERTAEYGNADYIQEIRMQNPKMDAVLSRNEELLKSGSDLDMQRAAETLERYKGTVFENELKDSLGSQFDRVEANQHLVQTETGGTKPDIVLRGALEDMKIGDLDIRAGEDLSIEAKCGSAEYIRGQMGHILNQVEGHEGNSLVVVTKDYLDLGADVRANFEKLLSDKGSHLYVADVGSSQVSTGLFSSLRQ